MNNMKFLASFGAFFLSWVVYSQESVKIQTSAICEMCQHTIEHELTFTKGIKRADLNLENSIITVEYNPRKINPYEIRQAITNVGYHADSLQRDSTAYNNLPFCCKDGGHDPKKE